MGMSKSIAAAALCLMSVCEQAHSQQLLSSAGEGRRLWLKYNCYGCHGMRAEGGMAENVQGEGAGIAREGSSEGMPSYAKYLTERDVKNLEAYLRSIGTTGEPTFTHWWEPIPSR